MIFGFDLLQWIADRIKEAMMNGFTGPLLDLVMTTRLNYTTQNPIIHQSWVTMTTAADLLLGLFLVIGAIQLMYGQATGTLQMPLGQFVARAILTAILIHLSAFLGESLLGLNNALCLVVQNNQTHFLDLFTKRQGLTNTQFLGVFIVLMLFFLIGMFRVLFQAIKRIIRFNVLFVLSGPAFLTSFHPLTAPIFSAWIRLYVVTIFEQFLQLLTLSLGFQFVLAAQHSSLTNGDSIGLIQLLLAAAMLNMAAEIPAILLRFAAASNGGGNNGLGTLLGMAVQAGRLFF